MITEIENTSDALIVANPSPDVYTLTGTYSPEDNKLRLYSATWLPESLYDRIYAVGYRWAPKQKLFVAPKWTPERVDVLLALCGDIQEDDDSLSGRAEFRARRFDGYRDNRIVDAELGYQRLEHLTGASVRDGQPIISAHHREERAERVARRIERVAEHTVTMWDTAEYWKDRVSAVLRHAKFKQRADVRARRIKEIESDKRRSEKTQKNAKLFQSLWRKLGEPGWLTRAGSPVTDAREQALFIAARDHISHEFPLAEFPRDPPASQYEGSMGLWSALDGNVITPEQAATIAISRHERTLSYSQRWINHFELRSTFERAMLAAQGCSQLLDKKPRAGKQVLPLYNYRAPEGLDVSAHGQMVHYAQVDMTAAEYADIGKDYKFTRVVGGSHRVRLAMLHGPGRSRLACVFLTDSKTHDRPAHATAIAAPTAEPKAAPARPKIAEAADDIRAKFERLREQIQDGVEVVTAPQLFASPPAVASRVIALARIESGNRVLEPSAGPGALIRAIDPTVLAGVYLVAVEISPPLAAQLRRFSPPHEIICANFLDSAANGGERLYTVGLFDRIVMNPPFSEMQDIQHIEHALTLLAPGGRLVAVVYDAGDCWSNTDDTEQSSPRRRRIRALRNQALVTGRSLKVEALPENSFASQGTGVRTAIVTIE